MITQARSGALAGLAGLAAAGLLLVLSVDARDEGPAAVHESYRARAINIAGIGIGGVSSPTATAVVNFDITRWSTDSERSAMLEALASKRQRLADVLRKMEPVGRVRITGRLGRDLYYARELVQGDQRVIVLATDRDLQFFESANRTRSSEYDIMIIELVLDKEGNGQGAAYLATKVGLNKAKDEVTVESFTNKPVMLTDVTRVE